MSRTTANWTAFDHRPSKAKSWKSKKTEYTVSAKQSAIDDNNAVIARLIAERKAEESRG